MTPSPRAPKTAFLALIRHARALPAGPMEPDSERALSAQGRASFELQLARLESMGFACDQLWTSPWKRARETAELVGARLGIAPQIHAGLCNDLDTALAQEMLAKATGTARTSRVLLVGHQPWLSQLARGLGASGVRDLECGEVLWLTERSEANWSCVARLYPS